MVMTMHIYKYKLAELKKNGTVDFSTLSDLEGFKILMGMLEMNIENYEFQRIHGVVEDVWRMTLKSNIIR